jgi:orotidine-5'-phosphate decarboxylase
MKIKKIIIAVDEISLDRFKEIINSLDSNICMVKVGSVSFNALGHEAILFAAGKGFDIFLDLKLHDIPNTVKKSIEGLTSLPIQMLTIHTAGGKQMMEYAMKAVKGTGIKVFGVTVLTSLSDRDTNQVYQRDAAEQVNAMLGLSVEAGIDGVVCSPHELNLVTEKGSLLSITPGIRLKQADDDQSRVMTPKQAIDLGANYIVIGRPITASGNIKEALKEIYNSIQ